MTAYQVCMSGIVMGDRYAKHFEVNSQAIPPRYLMHLRCLRVHCLELVLTCGPCGLSSRKLATVQPVSVFPWSLTHSLDSSCTSARSSSSRSLDDSLITCNNNKVFTPKCSPPRPAAGTYDLRHNWLPVLSYSLGFISQCLHKKTQIVPHIL
jgi:hypothetical protein